MLSFTLVTPSMRAAMMEEITYKGFKLRAVPRDNGWKVEIHSTKSGETRQTMTFSELEGAIDEAKKFVDALK